MNGVLSLFSSANEQGSIAVESPTKSGKCLCVLYQTFCEVCPHFLGLLIMHACIQLEWFSVRLVCILLCVCTGSPTLVYVCSVCHSHDVIETRTGASPGT